MSTTVNVVCSKYRPLKNNELPLKIRICKDRKARYFSLGVSVCLEHWDFLNNRPKAECPNKEYLEKLISNKISQIRSKIVELKSEDKDFTARSLKEKVANQKKPDTVSELFSQHICTLKQDKRIRYAESVELVYNSLLKFNKHLDIHFSEIDLSWLRRYESWLRKKGNAENTIGIRFRTLRMIYNLAIEMEIVKPELYPFRKYKVSKLQQSTAKRAISKEDIIRILNYEVSKRRYYTCLAKNLFAFSYFMGGINFVDMALLTRENLVDGRLIYRRKKTGKLIILPLQEKAAGVLEQYKNKNKPFLFPILSSGHETTQQRQNRLHKVITKVNKALNSIGEDLGIPIKLTTYVARHSIYHSRL